MDTNYKHYFGTPEKASKMRVERWSDDMTDGLYVWREDELIASLRLQDGFTFESWLEEDCGIREESVTVNIDGARFVMREITSRGKFRFDLECETLPGVYIERLMKMWPHIAVKGEITVSEC